MIRPTIVVTGATGKTSGVVTAELLKAGYPVRVLVHREDGGSTRLKARGAEIAVADQRDVERVAGEFARREARRFRAGRSNHRRARGNRAPAEDIARHYVAQPRNRRAFGNWLRQLADFQPAPLSPGFNFDRYDPELRRPFPSNLEFAPESAVWRHDHNLGDAAKPAAPKHPNKARLRATGRDQSLDF